MQRLHKFVATLSLAFAIIVTCSAAAFAKSDSARPRNLKGIVLSIDRSERVMVVREFGTGQTYKVHVREGLTFRTNQQSAARANFEQLIPGMMIIDAYVR